MRSGNDTEHIHLELPPPIGEGQGFDGAGDADTGIVDQACQAMVTHHGGNGVTRGRDGGLVGDVEANRHQARTGFALKCFAVGQITDAREDTVPEFVECEGTGGADTGGGAGNHDAIGSRSVRKRIQHMGNRLL